MPPITCDNCQKQLKMELSFWKSGTEKPLIKKIIDQFSDPFLQLLFTGVDTVEQAVLCNIHVKRRKYVPYCISMHSALPTPIKRCFYFKSPFDLGFFRFPIKVALSEKQNSFVTDFLKNISGYPRKTATLLQVKGVLMGLIYAFKYSFTSPYLRAVKKQTAT